MGDMRETLWLEEALDVDGAGLADPREVVAAKVDQHHVFRPVLLGREQACGVAVARRRRPGDRVETRAPAFELDQRLGRGADKSEAVELEQKQIGRRVDPAQRAVELERGSGRRSLGALR